MQSLPVVIIRCEENEIYQLDFRIQTDNIRCFILLSGLRNRLLGNTKGNSFRQNLFITVNFLYIYFTQVKAALKKITKITEHQLCFLISEIIVFLVVKAEDSHLLVVDSNPGAVEASHYIGKIN
jgi:hypothetical protein